MQLYRAVSYNLHSCIGTDGRYDPKRIVRAIQEIAPDVCLLQEVDSGYRIPLTETKLEQLHYIAQRLKMASYPGVTMYNHKGSYGNAILSNWPVLAQASVTLSFPGLEPRGGMALLLEVKNKRPVVFGVTHLGLRLRERLFQVERLLSWWQSLWPDCYRLLGGDFNEWKKNDKSIQKMNSSLGRQKRVRTFPAYWPIFALDRFWADPSSMIVKLTSHRSALSRKASDHLPLVAEFGLF